jgi:hypothetical protein
MCLWSCVTARVLEATTAAVAHFRAASGRLSDDIEVASSLFLSSVSSFMDNVRSTVSQLPEALSSVVEAVSHMPARAYTFFGTFGMF